jgi:hypothetical protein
MDGTHPHVELAENWVIQQNSCQLVLGYVSTGRQTALAALSVATSSASYRPPGPTRYEEAHDVAPASGSEIARFRARRCVFDAPC